LLYYVHSGSNTLKGGPNLQWQTLRNGDEVERPPALSALNYLKQKSVKKCQTTVDGRNPAPVDMVKIPLFTGFYTSQVVQDFFHQQ